ncbi:ras-related protein RabA-like [Amphiura filiformis]|uniref:ras-related protein RabA-like n=1 Tax=Amphiura filiformis TaxID=82378 RepID=UPI003B218BA9
MSYKQRHVWDTRKVILLGDKGTGKSSLFYRLQTNQFTSTRRNSIRSDFHVKEISVDSRIVKFGLWDTGGFEAHDSVPNSYCRGCHVGLLIFDLTNRNSLDNTRHWIQQVKQFQRDAFLYLVGTKSDSNEAKITDQQMEDFCYAYQLDGKFRVSSKTGDGIKGMCQEIARSMLAHPNLRKRESINMTNEEEHQLFLLATKLEKKHEQRPCGC